MVFSVSSEIISTILISIPSCPLKKKISTLSLVSGGSVNVNEVPPSNQYALLGSWITPFITINNVFDKDYERPDGYNQYDRTFNLGFRKYF